MCIKVTHDTNQGGHHRFALPLVCRCGMLLCEVIIHRRRAAVTHIYSSFEEALP
jgi:hypothetical protein